MKEVKRWKRIVAVRTTQRDISAMRLREAQHRALVAKDQLQEAERQLEEASQLAVSGERMTQTDLERMDLARIAAWEEIAVWQKSKQNAEEETESARTKVEAHHLMLRQSEMMGERVEQAHRARIDGAEQRLSDEQASRNGRGPL